MKNRLFWAGVGPSLLLASCAAPPGPAPVAAPTLERSSQQNHAQRAQTRSEDAKLEQTVAELASARKALSEAEGRLATLEAGRQHQGVAELQRTEDARGQIVSLPGARLFTPGRTELLPGATSLLDAVARTANTRPDGPIRIEGHTDNTGGAALNMVLSQNRAQTVRDYLIARGVPAARITVDGFGATRPIASNTTARGRALNRRIEVIFAKGDEPVVRGPM